MTRPAEQGPVRFVVYGAGAIGCYVGGRLAASGAEVDFVGRPHVVESLSREGLRVSEVCRPDVVLLPDRLRLAPDLDTAMARSPVGPCLLVVLVCVKTPGTVSTAHDITRHCPMGTVILSLQNGVDNPQRLRLGAPFMTTLAGMVPFTVNWKEGRHVWRLNRGGSLQIEHSPESEFIAPLLREAGIGVDLRTDMPAVLWGKLLLNLFNPLNALADMPIRAQLLERDHRLVFAALQAEALTVLKAANINPAQIGAAPPLLLPEILRLPDEGFQAIAEAMLRIDPSARTSMSVDLQAGRPTEIDDLCGAVVRTAAAAGVKAPLNTAVSAMIVQHRPGQTWSGAHLRQALGL
jgi:2-dehydropantoate 2-reductase